MQPILGQPGLFLAGVEGCRTEEVDTGGKLSVKFRRVCGPHNVVGVMDIARMHNKLRGRTVWFVDNVKVYPPHYRQGHATALYEAAAKFACSKRSTLASVSRLPHAYSKDFWEKQVRLGRATRVHSRMGYDDAFVLDVCHQKDRGIDLSGFEPPRWLGTALLGGAALLLLGATSGGSERPT